MQELDVGFSNNDPEALGARKRDFGELASALPVLDDDSEVGAFDEVIAAVAHKVVVLAVESAVMRISVALANRVAFLRRALPVAVGARAGVAIALDAAALLVLFTAVDARAFGGVYALAIVKHFVVRAATSFEEKDEEDD